MQATWNDPTATWGDLTVAWDGTQLAARSQPSGGGKPAAVHISRLHYGIVYRRQGTATLVLQASGIATVDRYAARHQYAIQHLVTIGEL